MSIETDTLVNQTHLLAIDYVARLENKVTLLGVRLIADDEYIIELKRIARIANDRIVMLECATEGYDNQVKALEEEVNSLKDKQLAIECESLFHADNSRQLREAYTRLIEDPSINPKNRLVLDTVKALEEEVTRLTSYNGGLKFENKRLEDILRKIYQLIN